MVKRPHLLKGGAYVPHEPSGVRVPTAQVELERDRWERPAIHHCKPKLLDQVFEAQ